jgi:Domain of unknown function (DUF4157)
MSTHAAQVQSTSHDAQHKQTAWSAKARRPVQVSPLFQDTAQRKANCACGGGCPRCNSESEGMKVQAKLAISSPGDHFEQEADHIADQVMRMPNPEVQRESNGGSDGATAISAELNESRILRHADGCGATRQVPPDLTSRLGGGTPLDLESRSYFEPRFGRDFSHVRVHDGDAAARSAAAINARAYTIGRDIVFGAGERSQGTTAGQRLLAHELTHVAQQAEGAPPMIRRALVLEEEPPPPAGDFLETPSSPIGDFWKNEESSPPDDFWKSDMDPGGGAVPLEEPNKAPGCDEVCGNSAEKCTQEKGEKCDDKMTKKVEEAWTTAGWQLVLAKEALGASELSSTTKKSLKDNFNWSSGNSPTDLPSTVSTNLDNALTKKADFLCIKCLTECAEGGKAQIARARGQNCLGSNCFRICPGFTADDTHVLIHELFHRVVSGAVEDLYRGQPGYPPPPGTALKMPDCYASLIDDVAPIAAAKKAAKDAAAEEKKAAAEKK